MEQSELIRILEGVKNGDIDVREAVLALKMEPFEDLGFAKIDHHRAIRQGAAEVIYGAGKTPEHICEIVNSMLMKGQERILITRMYPEAAKKLESVLSDHEDLKENDGTRSSGNKTGCKFTYDPLSRIGIVGELPEPDGIGTVVIATGGTSDVPVAEEAARTAEILGNKVVRLYDVGVSGLHRLIAHSGEIMSAEVIVAIAGMEGALASVIGGLADCPVIAVPTSVGYGASFGGVSALLSMLNSCASGVSVVNIDNGFGAGYLASMINHRRIV